MGWQVKAALTTSVYKKALRLSPAAKQGSTSGQVRLLLLLPQLQPLIVCVGLLAESVWRI